MSNSTGLKGGISTSTTLPCTLEIISEEEVLANEFCIIAMTISPGAINCRKLTPPISGTERPMASAKTARNRRLVTVGATIVCSQTLKKR